MNEEVIDHWLDSNWFSIELALEDLEAQQQPAPLAEQPDSRPRLVSSTSRPPSTSFAKTRQSMAKARSPHFGAPLINYPR